MKKLVKRFKEQQRLEAEALERAESSWCYDENMEAEDEYMENVSHVFLIALTATCGIACAMLLGNTLLNAVIELLG